ncbi:MAG: hypothetical protein ACK5W0_03090 [Labrys sp. (in: a-proteobacteria)]
MWALIAPQLQRWLLMAGVGLFAVTAAFAIGWLRGRDQAVSECQTAALQAQVEALSKDLAISRRAAALATERAQSAERAATENETLIEDFRHALEARSDGACRLDDDDARRLRAIK